MRESLVKRFIIGLALLLLAGCSALRVTYNNGPWLAWWWVDGYVDFSREQAPAVRQAIDQWFDWHRTTQLADTAALLGAIQAQLSGPVTPAQTCRWWDQARERLQPALDRALTLAAEPALRLREPEFRHLEQRYAKANARLREDHLQPDADERRKASLGRSVERAESIYGSLGEAQKRIIAASMMASPSDPEAWLAEREARQRDTLQTLRRLVGEGADAAAMTAALRALAERTERSPRPAYRSYQQRLRDANCALAAAVHNVTTPAQRTVARERLRGWESDLRALAVSAP